MQFCNSIQLNRVLPAGPRDYWNELALEHKKAPDHQQWMYATDPFQAAKEVEARQSKATERRAQGESQNTTGSGPASSSSGSKNEYTRATEIRMGSDLREQVESAIKKVDPSVFTVFSY